MFPRGHRHGGGEAPVKPVDEAKLGSWLTGRLPDSWFTEAPRLVVDREEITIIGSLPDTDTDSAADAEAAVDGRIKRFREQTRDERIVIAEELERTYRRKVAWGVHLGEREVIFTSIAAPAMTRLRQPERKVLDTLVDAGVARSRAEALAWCVRLVGRHEEDWLSELGAAMRNVDAVRDQGPASDR